MGIFQRIMGAFARRATFDERNGPSIETLSPFDERIDGAWGVVRGSDPALYRAAGETIRREGFEANAVVNACMRVVADQISVAHLESYTTQPDGTVVLHPDDELQRLMNQPGPQLSGFQLRRMTGLHLLGWGNSYWHITRNAAGQVVRLRPIHPERVQHIVVDDENDYILQYWWNTSSGKQVRSPWTDIVHIKDHVVDPDGWFGFPRGLAALIDLATDGDASKYVRQVLNNSGVPALVLFGRQGVSQDELKRAEQAWHERMTVNGERGRTRIVGGIEKLEVIGHSLKDLEFPLLRQISREDICAAFGVDPRLIGVGSAKGNEGGLSGSQYQEARRRLEQQTCQSLRMAIQEALDVFLTPEFGNRYLRFSPDAIASILETPTEVAQRTAVLVASHIVTLEEARRINGFAEEMDPQHTTTAPMLQTVQQAREAEARQAEREREILTAKDAQKGASVSEQTQAPTGSTSRDNNTDSRRDPNPPLTRQGEPVSRLRVRGAADLTSDELAEAWRAFDAQARALEPELQRLAAQAVAEVVNEVARVALLADERRMDGDEWTERFLSGLTLLFSTDGVLQRLWRRVLGDTLLRAMQRAAQQFAARAEATIDPEAPSLLGAYRRRLAMIAERVSGTIIDRALAAALAARAAGLSAAEIATMVRDMEYEDIAARTARTQSVGLINDAERVAVAIMGGVRSKAWLSQRDTEVRDSHAACDGQGWIDVEQAFQNGLQYPHDPAGEAAEVANCRCAAMYSDREPTT